MTPTIPAALRPRDGRFGSGPSKVPLAALQSLADQGAAVMGTSHRREPVKQLVARVRAGVRELLRVPDDYEVALGNGGSTQFWDVAVSSLIAERAQMVVCGEFSAKFASAVAHAPFLNDPSIRRVAFGTGTVPVTEDGIDTYCWPQNETSTGVALPVGRVDGGGLCLVDATSAAGAINVDISATDVYYFAPQKALAADGGLWLATLSPAAIERIDHVRERGDRWRPPSLDLGVALQNSRLDQTYNTPAIATLWLLATGLQSLLDRGGLAASAARSADSAARLYEWAQASPHWCPFVADPALRSPTVGTIDAVDVDAATVATVLRDNGIVDVEPYRGLGRNQLRIGMFPAVDPDDVSALTACIDWVVDHV